jgi:hypothetical protein
MLRPQAVSIIPSEDTEMPTSDASVPVRALQDIVIVPPDEDVEMPMPDESEPVETLEDVVITAPDEHLSSTEITPDVGR